MRKNTLDNIINIEKVLTAIKTRHTLTSKGSFLISSRGAGFLSKSLMARYIGFAFPCALNLFVVLFIRFLIVLDSESGIGSPSPARYTCWVWLMLTPSKNRVVPLG